MECFSEVDNLKLEKTCFLHYSDDSSNSLHCLRKVWEDNLSSKEHSIFFCRLISKTIEAYFLKEYTFFDAHTTTNCCHGIALLARKLILEISEIDLYAFKKLVGEKTAELETALDMSDFCIAWVPKALIKLSSLYLLATTRIISDGRMKTDARNLKEIHPIGTNFCWTIANNLKKNLSNLVALRYQSYLGQICPFTDINGAPIHLWGNYIQTEYMRTDKKNIHYVSCVFSTQVSLAYLVKAKAKIALVNDIVSSNGDLKARYVRIFEGDGENSFKVLSEGTDLLSFDQSEPVVVFGGYVYSDTLTIKELSQCMAPWLNEFPRLMLACDVFYPQFPGVNDDPNFDNSPIHPKEDILQKVFFSHAQIQGVSVLDPSLFCSSHTYLSSLGQITKTVHNNDLSALPTCFHGIHPLSREEKITNAALL